MGKGRRSRTGVLYIAPWVTIGGSDRNTIDWFRWIDRSRFRVYLTTTQESTNELFEEAARHAEGAWALPDLMTGSEMPGFIAEIIDSHRIDVVHVMNSRLGYDLIPGLKRAFPHLRAVAQLHAEEHPRGTGYPGYVTSRFGDSVDAYSVISQRLRGELVEYGAAVDRIQVIGLGVDTDQFNPERATPRDVGRRGRELHILFPARLTWQKDPLQVVEIARRLRDGGSDAVIHVVGDGDMRPEVETAVSQAKLDDRVRLHGFDLEMPSWYASTDVTLLPSRYEGIPLTLYESMAMARPVVVADVGGIAELVDDSIGMLIRDRDDPDAFVAALRRLEDDPELRTAMGRAGRQRAEAEFPANAVAGRHAALYDDLVARAPRRKRRAVLDEFADWWADDSVPLNLAVATTSPRAWLYTGDAVPSRAQATVRVGRSVTRPAVGQRLLSPGLGYGWDAPLPGMVELGEVLPGHLAGLWRAISDDPAPAPSEVLTDITTPVWVDTPYLLPEAVPRSPAT